MLRVLTLSTLFPDATRPRFGSFVERQTLALAAREDVEVLVVAPIGIPPFLSRHPKYAELATLPLREEWRGLTVYRPRFAHIPGVGSRLDTAMLVRAVLPLLREIRRDFAFDVIDAEFFFPDGTAAVKLGAALNVPVSIKARGSDIHRWAAELGRREEVVTAGRTVDAMMAVSAALKRDMVAIGLPAERIAVHHTGIDHEVFRVRDRAAAKAALGITRPLIVSIGTLNRRKGHGVVIEAMAQLPDAELVLIGAGPDRAAFEAQAAALGVQDRVRFAGALDHAAVAQWLNAANVMALMSQSEGLANVWVEALASGTPLVIADVGGAREVLTEPDFGRFATQDPVSVAEAVRALIDHPPAPSDVARGAAPFSWERNAAELHAHLAALKR